MANRQVVPMARRLHPDRESQPRPPTQQVVTVMTTHRGQAHSVVALVALARVALPLVLSARVVLPQVPPAPVVSVQVAPTMVDTPPAVQMIVSLQVDLLAV